jgi:hypothetical protein
MNKYIAYKFWNDHWEYLIRIYDIEWKAICRTEQYKDSVEIDKLYNQYLVLDVWFERQIFSSVPKNSDDRVEIIELSTDIKYWEWEFFITP